MQINNTAVRARTYGQAFGAFDWDFRGKVSWKAALACRVYTSRAVVSSDLITASKISVYGLENQRLQYLLSVADGWLLTARWFTDGLPVVHIYTSDLARRHERRYATTWARQRRLAFVQQVEDLNDGLRSHQKTRRPPLGNSSEGVFRRLWDCDPIAILEESQRTCLVPDARVVWSRSKPGPDRDAGTYSLPWPTSGDPLQWTLSQLNH